MKRKINIIITILILMVCLCVAACSRQTKNEDLWGNAIYTEDTQLGNGEKTVYVKVEAEGKSVTFTVKTDKETVGEALSEHKIISGEKGAYGLYVKEVNGITADYNVNKSYWSFNKNGEYVQTGVDSTKISDGEHYELVYTK